MKNVTLLLILATVIYSNESYGQTRTITGSGNWSTSGNWTGGNIGGDVDNNDDVVLNDNMDIVIQNGETYTIATFAVGKDGSLTINAGGALIITGTFLADKDFTINIAGDLTIQGDLDVAKSLVLNVTGNLIVNGNVTAAKDAVFDVQGSMQVDGDLISAKDAVVNVDGALTVAGDLNLGAGSVITGTGPVSAATCSGDACTDGQLPVELLYFESVVNPTSVKVEWATASEENNDYYSIERSQDGVNYELIATTPGAGNSTSVLEYSYIDKNPLLGRSYYRLTQTDFDGASETFNPIAVDFTTLAEGKLRFGPNPVNRGDKIRIETQTNGDEILNITVYNMVGEVVLSNEFNGSTFEFNLDQATRPGVYFIKVSSVTSQKTGRLLVR
jgi:cytoskeletal protein CcmA (bactofilin family)